MTTMNDAEREAFDAWWKLDAEGSENKAAAYEGWKARAAYAQGDPANQREAFRSWCESIGYPSALMTCGDLAAFQAGAAWQRAQVAVLEGYALVSVELLERIDRFYMDGMSIYGELEELRAMLAAAPAHPAERQEQGEVQRLREALSRIRDHAARIMDDEVFYEADSALAASTGQEVEK